MANTVDVSNNILNSSNKLLNNTSIFGFKKSTDHKEDLEKRTAAFADENIKQNLPKIQPLILMDEARSPNETKKDVPHDQEEKSMEVKDLNDGGLRIASDLLHQNFEDEEN